MLNRNNPIDETVAYFFKSRRYLGSHDRAFISENVYGIIRHRRAIEELLHLFFPTLALQESQHYITYFLAYYVLQNKERESDTILAEKLSTRWHSLSFDITIDNFLQTARQIFTKRLSETDGITNLGINYSFPDWFVEKCLIAYGETQTEQLLISLNQQAPTVIRVNTLLCTREQCKIALKEERVECEETKFSPFGLILKKRMNVQTSLIYKQGWYEFQDEGSQLLSIFVNARENETILDACSGAGGKSLAIAAMMNNKGNIFAFDIEEMRIREMQQRLQRASVNIVKTNLYEHIDTRKFISHADAVLLDVPCTGSGTIRRNPMLKWKISEESIAEKTLLQQQLIEEYSQFVKPGGRLIYATCSLFCEENENIVESFLKTRNNFRVVSPAEMLSRYSLPHLENERYLHLLPHLHNTDGFFAAMMIRDF